MVSENLSKAPTRVHSEVSTVVGAVPPCHPPPRAQLHQRSHGPSPLISLILNTRSVRAVRVSSPPVSAGSASGTERRRAARPRSWSRSAAARSGEQGVERTESGCFRTGTRTVCARRVSVERRPSLAGTRSVAGVTDARRVLSVGALVRRSRSAGRSWPRVQPLHARPNPVPRVRPAMARSRAHGALGGRAQAPPSASARVVLAGQRARTIRESERVVWHISFAWVTGHLRARCSEREAGHALSA
jgi:hypothetical protein